MKPEEETNAAFDAHRLEQILNTARTTTPAQRLARLEEMVRLAWRTHALPKKRP